MEGESFQSEFCRVLWICDVCANLVLRTLTPVVNNCIQRHAIEQCLREGAVMNTPAIRNELIHSASTCSLQPRPESTLQVFGIEQPPPPVACSHTQGRAVPSRAVQLLEANVQHISSILYSG